jgi:hypothetical protein
MRQLSLNLFAATAASLVLIFPAFPQVATIGGVAQVSAGGIGLGSGASSSSMSGPGFSMSSRGDNNGTTFTYNFTKGAMVVAVTGAPYSGHSTNQTVRTLSNGTHLTQASNDQPMTYRDTMGRTRTDAAMSPKPPVSVPANFQPRINRLPEITDPVAGYRYILDPVHQIAYRTEIQARQSQANPGPAAAARMVQNVMPARTMPNGSTMQTENLGTQTMFGVKVIGTRNTTTYPVGTYQGNDQPVTQTNEMWRAAQYNIVLLSKNSGPESDSTMSMADFSPNEPDPSLFQVPPGYQIVDETAEFTITIPRSGQ